MLLTGITCPIDALAVVSVTFDEKGIAQPRARGDHLHIEADQEVTCLNGHTWQIVGGFQMERK